MIECTTKCENCIHKKVCKNKGNAESAANKLKKTTYGTGPNDDYDWDIMMGHFGVNIAFTCPNYEAEFPRVKYDPGVRHFVKKVEE